VTSEEVGPADQAEHPEPGSPEQDQSGHTALPPKLESWRRRSAAGAVLTGFALGLQEALDIKKEEPAIVMQASGDPPSDLPVETDLGSGRPRHSVVQIRPWLFDQAAADGEGEPGEAPEA
jgi:hypothetical protein